MSTKRVPRSGILSYLALSRFLFCCQIEAEEDISRDKGETSRVGSIELSDRGRIRLEYHFWSFVRIDRDQMSTKIQFESEEKEKKEKEHLLVDRYYSNLMRDYYLELNQWHQAILMLISKRKTNRK